MPHRELEDYEAAARSLRQKMQFERSLRPDMITGVIKLKHLGLIKNYLRVSCEEMPDDESIFNSLSGILSIREDIFRGANAFVPRDIMTLAHEFGHVTFEHTGILHRNTAGRQIEKIHLPTKIKEIEAKRFAAAFVAPAYLCSDISELTPQVLEHRFPISAQAAAIRASDIVTLRRRASGQGRPLPDFVTEFLREAKDRGVEIKTPLD